MGSVLSTYRQAFGGLPRPVWWLALVVLVNRTGTMVLPFLILYLTRVEGYTIDQAGLFLGAYGVGAVAGVSLGGRLTDRLGPRRVQMASLGGTGALMLVLGSVEGPAAIAVTLVCLSLATEAFRPANSAAVAAATRPDQRSQAYALQRLAINLGMSLGPVLGGFLAERNYALLFWVDGATCLAAAVLVAAVVHDRPATVRDPLPPAPSGPSPWSDRLFVAAFGLMVIQGLMFWQVKGTLVHDLRDRLGFGETLVGCLLAINTVVIVLFEMILVRRVRRHQALRVNALATLLTGLGLGLLGLGTSVGFVALTVLVWTLGEMLSAPTMSAFTANRAGPTNRGRYMGAYALAFSLSGLLAPVLGTRVYGSWGAGALWGGIGALGLVTAVGFWALARVQRRLEPDPSAAQ